MTNAADARGKPAENAAQSVRLILPMPPGTPPDRIEAAARIWAREPFARSHDWTMAQHDDTDHSHVHATVRAVSHDGRRLAPGPAELQAWAAPKAWGATCAWSLYCILGRVEPERQRNGIIR